MRSSCHLLGFLVALACLVLAPSAHALVYNSNFGRAPDAHAFSNGTNLGHNGMAVEADGDVVIADASATSGIYRLQVRTATGTWKTNIGADPTHATGPRETGELSFPSDVAVAPNGDLHVMDSVADKVVVFTHALAPDNDTYTFSFEYGGSGSALGQFNDATGITIAPGGSVYTTDFGNSRVTKFSGAGVAQYAYIPDGPADLNGPMAIAERDGTLYIGEYTGLRVTRLIDSGAAITLAPTNTHFGSGFSKVAGLDIDPVGRVYVADDAAVKVFQASDGAAVATLTACCSGSTLHPRGVAYGNGGIYVFDQSGAAGQTRIVRYVNTLPTANFTFAPSSPSPAPNDQITLTSTAVDNDPATSTSSIVGAIALVKWDLDNDGAYDDATGNSAQTSFATAGPHTVGQEVTDNEGGKATTSQVITVVANQPPQAQAAAAPNPALTGETVNFTVAASDPDGSVANIEWDLDNNGSFEVDSDATSRSFPDTGTFTVSVRATDNKGLTAVNPVQVTVTQNQPPTVTVAASPASAPSATTVTFTASPVDPDGRPLQLAWDLNNDGVFNDGTGTSVTNAKAKSGALVAKVQATDSGGATATGEATATITNRAPAITVSTPAGVTAGTPTTLTATATDSDGTIASVAWDLDNDGAFDDATGARPSATFPAAGSIPIKALATDDEGATATGAATVTVKAATAPAATKPPADTKAPTGTLTLPKTVTTTPEKAASTGIVVPLKCSETCRPAGVMLITKKVAKSLKLTGLKIVDGKAVVGTSRVQNLGGKRYKMVIRLYAKVHKAFTRSKLKQLTVTMQIELKDLAGNIAVIERKITIRRAKKK